MILACQYHEGERFWTQYRLRYEGQLYVEFCKEILTFRSASHPIHFFDNAALERLIQGIENLSISRSAAIEIRFASTPSSQGILVRKGKRGETDGKRDGITGHG
jgi:hypothetical protein